MNATAHSRFDFGPLAEEYDRWYDTPAGQHHDQYQKALVQRFLPQAKPGQQLLDVGCGSGHWSHFFVSLGYRVVGVDVSERMIDTAKAKALPQCLFELADACDLPFDADFFDVVAAMTTLEFVSDTPKALSEMFRCVKPSGRVLIGTLNRDAPINRHRLVKGKQPYASGRLLSFEELHQLLEPFGQVRIAMTDEHAGKHALWPRRLFRRYLLQKSKSLSGAFIMAEVRT